MYAKIYLKWQGLVTKQEKTEAGRQGGTLPRVRGKRLGKAGEMGSLTISYCCNLSKHVPKGDFTWFYFEEGTARKKANRRNDRHVV